MLQRCAVALFTVVLAGCAGAGEFSASPSGLSAAVPLSECAVYAAGMRSQHDVRVLNPTAAAISPVRRLTDLEGDSPQKLAGFALRTGRRAPGSIGGCDLGPGVSFAPDGLLASRLLFRRDGTAAIFLLKGPFTRRAVVVERGDDGVWRAHTVRDIMVDPPIRVPRLMLEDPEAWNALSDAERFKALGRSPPP